MDLSIIIVNWRSADYLRACLTSVYAHTRGIRFEVIVIDSASFDGCDRMLAEHFADVRFIQSAENLGFARANNRAFEQARGEAVLFLNPDTEVRGDAITRMLAHLRALPDAGCLGCRLLNTDGSVQTSCIQSFPTVINQLLDSEVLRARWPRSSLWGMAALFEPPRGPREVEAVSGACVMLRREVCARIGRFSEDYFMYAEDIDLSHKARAAGLRNYYVPDAEVVHHGGSSTQHAVSDFSVVMMREAIWRFLHKTRGRAHASCYRLSMFLAALVRLAALACTWPVRALRGTAAAIDTPSRKWRAVLKWCLHRDPSVRRHYTA